MTRRAILQQLPLLLQVVVLYGAVAYFLHTQSPSATPVAATFTPAYHTPTPSPAVLSGTPVRLEIPRLGISLAIEAGGIDPQTNDWILSNTAAHFAPMTAPASEAPGNTLIYGHNTPAVLMPTSGLMPGDTLIITTANGHVFTYSYRGDESVIPSDTHIVTSSSATPQVSLLTCEGMWSDKRRIMYFDLVEAHA